MHTLNRRQAWLRRALWFVGATAFYNTAEAAVALAAGIQARSVALVGFGLDSVIECAAAAVMLWRLRVESHGLDPDHVERAEHRVRRFIGLTFLLLALYVAAQSIWILARRDAPAESLAGIVLAALSLVVMPLVAWGKIRAAREINSRALLAEAKETLACSYLSLSLFLGLLAHSALGWWWADPLAAILMVPWLIKEGMEGVRAEGCCDC